MAKLSLQPKPTFTVSVGIPVPGSEPALVGITFKHRTKAALTEFANQAATTDDVTVFMGMVTGWDLDVEFNQANASELLENYIGAGVCIYNAYIAELAKAKMGN
jgi:hypothetical protein